MAATAEGAALTRRHQQMQLQLRASAIADWTKLWPIWDGSGERFRQLADASVPLAQNYHRMSAGIALDYYKRLRTAEIEKSKGAASIALPELPAGQIAGTLYVTGRDMTDRALKAGQSPQAAMQNALVRTAGSLTRLILNGGREALVQASLEDDDCRGYYRVTTGTCDFCARLASYGLFTRPDFQAHDHCACVAQPAFGRASRTVSKIAGREKGTKMLLGIDDAADAAADDRPATSGGEPDVDRRKVDKKHQSNPKRED